MPGPAFEGESPDILRATLQELESADWWRVLQLDGVLMVAWARHRDTPIVRAIAASGTHLVLHIDSNGSAFPLFRQIETLKTFWRAERGTHRGLAIRSALFLKEAVGFALIILLLHTYQKYRHLRYANVVALTTPTSVEGHEQLCSFFGGKNHGVNLQMIGCPVPQIYRWDSSIPKEKRVICIGRWEDLRQKRPYVLMDVCTQITRRHPDLQIDIFGTKTDALTRWHGALEPQVRERIHLHGFQPPETIAQVAQKSQISFFPSSRESLLLSLFETLACGASSVGLDSPDMPGLRWVADYHHADLVPRDTTEAFVAAIDRGLEKWERGEYSARQISDLWVEKTRLSAVLGTILDAAAQDKMMRKHG